MNKSCSSCGKSFGCQNEEGTICWCSKLPAIIPFDFRLDCLCEACLKKKVLANIEEFIRIADIHNLSNYNLQQYHSPELIEEIDYNLEQGNYVFTKWYLLKRGFCCKNGCRNCPYNK